MGGVEDEEPPSKRIKSLQFCTQNSLFLPQSLSLSPKSPNPLEFGGLMARPLPSKGKQVSQTETLIGSKGVIRKNEFVRIITRALYTLGYERTGSILEEESGIQLLEPVIHLFREQVLDGEWDESVQTLHKIGLADQTIVDKSAFLILEQKFLEQIENGEILKATKTLQGEISPLGNTKRVHELAFCLLGPTRLGELGWSKGQLKSRVRVLEELQSLFPPSVFVPDRRLEDLVQQTLAIQTESCYFHNFKDKTLSLYADHKCDVDQIPSRTIQVLDAHQDEVWYIQFSNNGKYLASASHDMSAIIWEVNGEGKLILKHKLTGHKRPVLMVAWSSDDRRILTCGMEECVRLWDVETGKCMHVYVRPNKGLISCGFFANTIEVYTGSTDKVFSTWNPDNTEAESVKGQRLTKTPDLAVSKDGKFIFTMNKENRILILERESKAEVSVIAEENSITSFTLSADDQFLLVNLSNEEIHLWCISKPGAPILARKYSGHRRTRFVIRSCFGGTDQGFIASGSEDSQVYIWHRASQELIDTLEGHSGVVNCVSWNPVNPHMLASASDDKTVRIWGTEKVQSPKWKDVSENGSCSNGVVVHQCNGNTN